MDLKTLLGESYKEGMTIEEIENALSGLNLVDPSTLPKSVSKEVFDKTASELAKVKKELKKLQESTMTEEEKLKEETEKAQELQKTYAKELSKLKATEMFVAAGLSEDDYAPLLDAVVTEDGETTEARAKSVVDLISAQRAVVEKAVKAELLKSTARPPAGSGGAAGGDFEKEIEAARTRGDMATVAALIRQQAMSETK